MNSAPHKILTFYYPNIRLSQLSGHCNQSSTFSYFVNNVEKMSHRDIIVSKTKTEVTIVTAGSLH